MRFNCEGHEYRFINDHKFQYRILDNYGTVVAYVEQNSTFDYWELNLPSPDNKNESVFVTKTPVDQYMTESWLGNWAVTQYVAFIMGLIKKVEK